MLRLLSAATALALDFASLRALAGYPIWPQHALIEVIVLHLTGIVLGVAGSTWFFQPVRTQAEGGKPDAVPKRETVDEGSSETKLSPTRAVPVALVVGLALPVPGLGMLLAFCFAGVVRFVQPVNSHRRYVYGASQILTERPVHEAVIPVRSVLDTLHGTDAQSRRNAILALRDVDPRHALPVLQKAIQDSDEQVRLLAQTLMNQMMADIESRIKKLEAALEKAPCARRFVQLAEQYHELVFLGLCSPETKRIYLERALDLLNRAGGSDMEDTAALMLRMKCLAKSGDHAGAAAALDALEKRNVSAEILAPWRAELCFQKREWRMLRTVLAEMRRASAGTFRLQPQIEFWAGSAMSAEPQGRQA